MGRDILFIRLRYLFGIWTIRSPTKVKTDSSTKVKTN